MPYDPKGAARAEPRRRHSGGTGRFLAQSIDKTTIAEIAEDADLTPMSVYRYFGSKQAIAVAVANHLLDAYLAEHSARCEAARTGAPENGYETFSRVLGAYIDTYEAHPEYIRFLQDMAFYALREQLTESVRYMCFSRPVATGWTNRGARRSCAAWRTAPSAATSILRWSTSIL